MAENNLRLASIALLSIAILSACSDNQGSPAPEIEASKQALAAPSGAPSTGTGTNAPATKRVVWVKMREKANLTSARAVTNWRNRGDAVRRALVDTASRSQASIKTFLSQRGARVRSFHIANALRVEADQATIDAIEARSDVDRVIPDRIFALPPLERSAGVLMTEWGLDSIRVPEAWDEFGLKGEGIVVANIDTGAQFDHPALVAQYRGNTGGSFDHNYNWFDPSRVCGSPSLVPCDNAGHGTHTMGTMVGDDGDPGPNQIGVAPHAKWIAAKGCEDFGCSFEALLASAEWVLAPTDLNGQNPRPDLRPNIVNNSWGGGGGDPFFQDAVDAWVAAGIFPVFSAGNSGPFCGSVGSPGDYLNAYAVGAYDELGRIADFSSRGPSFDGAGKPNIAAPGVFVRSSVPGNGYEFFDGTSMAAPHLAGTIALMWSAAPALVGDIATTRQLLDDTAVDVLDESCGGDADNNNVWGEGRLDAFAAIDASPRGPTGTLAGSVTGTSGPIVGAVVRATNSEGRVRSASTGAAGTYSLRLPVGEYTVSARAFGYLTEEVGEVVIAEAATTTQDFALDLAPAHPVSGTVLNQDGEPVVRASVSIVGTPIAPVLTGPTGQYSIPSVPEGEYEIAVSPSRCYGAETAALVVNGAEVVDFSLDARVDAYGYSCEPVDASYVAANTIITEESDYTVFPITLPFPFTFYGQTYESASIATDGFVSFLPMDYSDGWNVSIPEPFPPNAAIYALWDELFVSGGGSIRTESLGTAPNRRFVIEWRDVQAWDGMGEALSFEIILHENGTFALQYGNATTTGARATIGIEDQAGAVGLEYSFDDASVDSSTAILYTLPPSGIVRGVVTDFNDGLPIAGATVAAYQGSTLVRAARTNAEGRYQVQVPVGAYSITASRDRYTSASVSLSVAQDQIYTQSFALRSAKAVVTPGAVQVTTTPNQTRLRKLTLKNEGSIDMQYEISEAGGARQQTVATRSMKRVAGADANALTTRQVFVQQGGHGVRGWTPNAAGDVIASFPTSSLEIPWGVGYTGNLWISDPLFITNTEFEVDGTETGRQWVPSFGGWPADMAFDGSRNLVCQVSVGADNGIHCFNPDTGAEEETIAGSFPWTQTSQRGLAYRESDDTFYIGGWNEGVIYHIQGLSHPEPGAVIEQCAPSDGAIAGLAWNDSMQVLWASTNTETDTIYELNPEDCTVLATLAHPEPFFNGAGLEMDESGNLWTASQNTREVFLIDSGVPAFSDVPWLSVTPSSGTLAPGASRTLDVTINTAGLTPGIYLGSIFVRSNSGRESAIRVPVSLVVSAYLQAANSGGNAYTDATGDVWAADKAHAVGSWGYVQKGSVVTTNKTIAGTTEQKLYKDARQDPYAYRYDSVPNGIYEIDMRFAELSNLKFGKRLYDVIVENTLVLPAHDIVYDVGNFAADDHRFFVEVTDGRLDVRLVPRARSEKPLINAIRVTHRPDR